MLSLVYLDEKEAESLINDSEIRPEESLQTLVLKIFQKTCKWLHVLDIVYVVVNIGYYEAHDKEIPQDPSRSIRSVLRQDKGICKLSQGIYGLSEWQNVPAGVVSNKETEVVAQAAQEDLNNVNNKEENFEKEEKNCPKCHKEINIRRHFCPYCAVDLFKFCSKCLGEIEKDDAIFCADCGIKLEQKIGNSTFV